VHEVVATIACHSERSAHYTYSTHFCGLTFKISSFVFYNVVKVISCQAVLLSNNLALSLSLSLTEIFSNTTQGLLVPAIVCRSLNEAVMKMQWSFTPSDANLLTIGTTSRAHGKSGKK
jgi:hypothetical protein